MFACISLIRLAMQTAAFRVEQFTRLKCAQLRIIMLDCSYILIVTRTSGSSDDTNGSRVRVCSENWGKSYWLKNLKCSFLPRDAL